MNLDQFELVLHKMDMILRILALNNIKELKIQSEKILALSSYGFTPSEIAALLNTTSNTVSVTLSKAKKKGTTDQVKKAEE